MKLNSTTLGLLASAASLSSAALAAPPKPPDPKVAEKAELDAGQRAVMKAVFESAITGDKTTLSAVEFGTVCADFQKRMLAALNPKARKPPTANPLPASKLRELFTKADINKNKALSLAEFQKIYPDLKVAIFRANPTVAPWILTDPCPWCGRG